VVILEASGEDEGITAGGPVAPEKQVEVGPKTCRGEIPPVTHVYIRPFTRVTTPFITIVGAHLVHGFFRDFSNLKETDPDDMGSCSPG